MHSDYGWTALGGIPTDVILRPWHLHPHVSTPEDYRREQARAIDAKRDAFPNIPWSAPWAYDGPARPVKVSDSMWQLVCGCGNCPMFDPEWELACCYTCGAIFTQAPPAMWRAVERVLLCRPKVQTRHWLPSLGETLDTLMAENRQHGDPVPTGMETA